MRRQILLLSALLLVSPPAAGAAAADSARPAAGDPQPPAWEEEATRDRAEALAALAESIPRRRRALAATPREQVIAEVARRAAERGVEVAPELLADALVEAGTARLELDACRVEQRAEEVCRPQEALLLRAERRFERLAAMPVSEFVAGGPVSRETLRELLASDPERLPDGSRSAAAAAPAAAGSCSCSVLVASSDRWVSGSWGVECGWSGFQLHWFHGSCGTSDIAHGAGCGAMTGRIGVLTFEDQLWRSCPDDHRTCFRGPALCDDGGSWGNVCSCDTRHCSPSPPGLFFDCNAEQDAGRINQVFYQGVELGGGCGSTPLVVREIIDEHDPYCCDDRLGELRAVFFPPLGLNESSQALSDTRCSGHGSSECGSFGATITLRTFCTGTVAPMCGDGECNGTESCNSCEQDCGACSCEGLCESPEPVPNSEPPCFCDQACVAEGDCCPDYEQLCTGGTGCGDGVCVAGEETCASCEVDCLCPAGTTCQGGQCLPPGTNCGDGVCTGGVEDCGSCPGDCPCPGGTVCQGGQCVNPGPVCGDGSCAPGVEDCGSCPGDCPCPGGTVCQGGQCVNPGPVCGDGSCAPGVEDCGSCPGDCPCPGGTVCQGGQCVNPGPVCGDGSCAPGVEDCGSCPGDCPCPAGTACQGGQCVPTQI